MPSSFTNFIYLSIDFYSREERIEILQHLPPNLLTNPVEIADHLRTIKQINEKLHFPIGLWLNPKGRPSCFWIKKSACLAFSDFVLSLFILYSFYHSHKFHFVTFLSTMIRRSIKGDQFNSFWDVINCKLPKLRKTTPKILRHGVRWLLGYDVYIYINVSDLIVTILQPKYMNFMRKITFVK